MLLGRCDQTAPEESVLQHVASAGYFRLWRGRADSFIIAEKFFGTAPLSLHTHFNCLFFIQLKRNYYCRVTGYGWKNGLSAFKRKARDSYLSLQRKSNTSNKLTSAIKWYLVMGLSLQCYRLKCHTVSVVLHLNFCFRSISKNTRFKWLN